MRSGFGIAVWFSLMISPALLLAGEDLPSLDAFVWLEGAWERPSRGSIVVESWRRVSESTMEGTAIRHSGDEARVTEFLRLEQMGGEIFYVAKPLENDLPTPFELVESSSGHFVFENLKHDFPQRIIYTRRSEDGLTVRIEGPMGGEEGGIDFVFTRRP